MNEQITVNLDNLTEDERGRFIELLGKAANGESGEKNRIWKPEIGSEYYFVSDYADPTPDHWDDVDTDRDRLNMGNVFKTKKEAEFAIEKAEVKAELQRYALMYNDPEKKWDGECLHFGIRYVIDDHKLIINQSFLTKDLDAVYFPTEEITKDVINKIGEKRIIKYLFDPDCEVE